MAPSWAEVVRRGGVLPPAGTASNSYPPAAGHRPSPPFATLLNLYRRCKRERRWACLTLETVEGEEELNFCWRGISSSAAATVSSAPATRRRGRKRPPNERRREKERRRREQQAVRRREGAAAGAEAPGAAQLAAATPSAAVSTAATLGAAKSAAPSSVVAATAAAINAANPLVAAINVAAINSAGSPVAVTPTSAATAEKTVIAAIAEVARPERAATAALRERSKLAAGERRASARTLVLARRREGMEPVTPETLRFAEVELSSLDISLDLVDRDSVFSPIPGEGDEEVEPVVKPWPDPGELPKEWLVIPEGEQEKPACSEREQRELEADLERIADQLTATLSAACSRKKKIRK
jgi:hypothetical protein